MPSPIRIAIPLDGMDPEAWPMAVAGATAIGERVGSVTDVVLLTHTRHQLSGTSLAGAMGPAVAKALLGGRTAGFGPSARLHHMTLKTMARMPRGAVVIAFYADDRMLEAVDGIDALAGVVAVPDLPGQIAGWIRRWNPLIPGQEQGEPAPILDDPVVERALTALNGWVNLSHAVMNPRDKGHADETLRILRANGHALDPEGIASWAIRNGWKPGAARELGALAGRIGALRGKPSLASFHDPKGRYGRWRA